MAQPADPHSTLSRDEAGLPLDVDVDELNQYLREWDRRLFRRSTWPFVLMAVVAAIGVAWLLHASLSIGWMMLWASATSVVTFFGITLAISANDRRCGIYNSCPQCGAVLRITLDRPQGLWVCQSCGFEHFKNWRARNSA